jgi:hypothetical protein
VQTGEKVRAWRIERKSCCISRQRQSLARMRPMSDPQKPERIPLPPVVLSVVPCVVAVAVMAAGFAVFPTLGPVSIVLAGVVVFGLTLALLARRVRRDDD